MARAGIYPDAIAAGQAASPQVVRNSRRMIANDYERNVVFTPTLRIKDVEYALQFAKNLEIGCPFDHLAWKQFRQLCELGYSDTNESKIIEVARLHILDGKPERIEENAVTLGQ